ncbi:MAG: bifunctional [glutamate--ammonia ligase]-adenylyl-L-tyrosine phosphorylase/[glutamate--ammonia-ligase] adenylyltransferase [Proteobacteria bacterium]|nr:bifunctional [glutamate--ammonia ligase]-adenylyl-L-tyrosine phosphorylase/[glutamate--ammonia-ligase] adenylyltransferase [Pseudomonadota bacterium]
MQQLLDNYLHALPATMKKFLLQAFNRYQAAADLAKIHLPSDPVFLKGLWLTLAASDYVTNMFCQYPSWPVDFIQEAKKSYSEQDFLNEWQTTAKAIHDEVTLMKALRQFRHKAVTRIIWRELLALCTFEEHLLELSNLADVCIKVAVEFLYEQACVKWGTPYNEQQQAQPLVVLAVGKLGAQELNLSSDVDLIFTYPDDGYTSGVARKITNLQFFTKLGQQLIKVLANITDEGFVYRVDMRLRPHGQSGSLVLNFNAIENYYQFHGRDWERYALIKARVITGDSKNAQKLMSLLHPFVYRRYLDYGAFESLRQMHDLVAQEVKRKQLQKDIKMGPGGIRQIEFLAQAFQLIRGGQNPAFQHRQLLIVLSRLAKAGYVEKNVGHDLERAYIFLRKSEHRLQLFKDEQTHALPKNPLDRARLYFTMGFPSWAEYQTALKRHLFHVSTYFNVISSAPASAEKADVQKTEFALIWFNLNEPETPRHLEKMGYHDAFKIQQLLLNFRESRTCQNLKKHASVRLDKIMPVLIAKIAKQDNAALVIERMLRFMQSIAKRSAYLALLLENPKALDYLINIAQKSEWVFAKICDYPVLIDELLSPPFLGEMLDKSHLEKELDLRMNWLSPMDLEGQMDHLRQFKLAYYLQIALLEMDEKYTKNDLMTILNNIVEVILNKVYELSLEFMIRHYQLTVSTSQLKEKMPFGIVAYGKLGARELSYQSDLDLVFLYDMQAEDVLESQNKFISNEEFSLRLAQRIIHILSTHTSAGTLYEVDVRLRPGGSAGLLVSSFGAFKKYLHEQAWTWEHQALVKARLVVGPNNLAIAFENLRQEILTKARSKVALKQEISKMREKMHEQHRFIRNEIKMVKGGFADVDFIAQYYMLLKAHDFPHLIKQRSALGILQELLANKLIDKNEATMLIQALLAYQKHIRRKIFQDQDMHQDQELSAHLENVRVLWQRIFNAM